MASNSARTYFEKLQEWSARKINLIEKYVNGAARILQEHGQVYYLDAFAGRGEYGKPCEPAEPGSPLRAARIAQMCSDKSYNYSLRCINIEENEDNAADLRRVLAPYQRFAEVHQGTFVQHVDTALSKVGRNPLVCFIDPFGVEGMDWDAVEKVIRKQGVSDLWIRFDAPYVIRLDGFHASDAPEAPAKRDLLTRTYGLPLPQIHAALRGINPDDRRERAVKLYQKQLQRAIKSAKGECYTGSYELTSLDGEDKYYLVFAAARKKAYVLASNVVYLVEEEHKRDKERYRQSQSDATGQLSLVSLGLDVDPPPQAIFEDTVNRLTTLIWDTFRGQSTSREDIHAYLLEGRFGQFGKRHMTEVLRRFSATGHVSLSSTPGDEDVQCTFSS